jgi:hypothetical protein
MPAVFWRLPPGQEISQIPIPDRADLRQPFPFRKLRFVKGIALAGKAQYRLSPVQQNILSYHVCTPCPVCKNDQENKPVSLIIL